MIFYYANYLMNDSGGPEGVGGGGRGGGGGVPHGSQRSNE